MGSKSKPGQDVDDGFFELPLSGAGDGELVIDHGRKQKKPIQKKTAAQADESAVEEVVTVPHQDISSDFKSAMPDLITGSAALSTIRTDPELDAHFERSDSPLDMPPSPQENQGLDRSPPQMVNPEETVIVPGGVSDKVPDVSAFFNSRYRNRHVGRQQSARSLPQASVPQYAQQQTQNPGLGYVPAAPLVKPYRPGGSFLRLGVYGGVAFGLVLLILVIFILPNRPMNVYKTAMERSAKGLDEYRQAALSSLRMAELSNSALNGELKVKNPATDLEASLSGSFASGRIYVAAEGKNNASGANFNFNAMSDYEAFLRPKDTSFKFGGDPTTLEVMKQGFSAYGEKWVVVAPETTSGVISQYSDAYSSLLPGLQLASQAGNTYKADLLNDATSVEFLKVLTDTFSASVLTTDENAVFDTPEVLGDFEEDNVRGKKYVVQLNKTNYGQYCKAQREAILSSESFVTLTATAPEKVAELNAATDAYCEDLAVGAGDGKTYEVWIDTKHKVVAKIRASLDASPQDYVEIGQQIVSDDSVEIFIGMKASEVDMSTRLGLIFDKKKKDTIVTVRRDAGNDASTQLKLTFVPDSENQVLTDKPDPQATSTELLDAIGLDLLEYLAPQNPNTFL